MTTPRVQAARLTAAGRGAVAVVSLWGPDALSLADRLFVPHEGRSLAQTPPGRPRVGRIGPPPGEEVVAVVIDAAEPRVEIHGHGGEHAVETLLERLAQAGAVLRGYGPAARALTPDRLAAEALVALSEAATEAAAAILLDQLNGALAAAVRAAAEQPPDQAISALEELIARGSIGLRLRSGWTLALAGRPNVGKSRLLNALAGFDRVIVSAVPGTTRDVVTLSCALGGWPVEVLDTAGRRDARDPLEALGIQRGRARQRDADLTLVVLDRAVPLTADDHAVLAECPGALRVANKADRPPAWNPAEWDAWPISATTGAGLAGLVGAIVARLVPDRPSPGSAVPFEPRHLLRLRRARALLSAGRIAAGRRALRDLLAARATISGAGG